MTELTSLQRMTVALDRNIPDTVPIFLRELTLGLDVAGYKTPEVFRGSEGRYDAEKSAKCVIATYERLRHDGVVGCIQCAGMDVEALGGKMKFPDYGIPSVIEYPFKTAEDVDRATIPDLCREEPFKGIIRSYQIVSNKIGREVAIVANVEGPVTKAGLLRGLDKLSLDFIKSPELAEKIVRFSAELVKEYLRALFDAGANWAAFIAGASDNPTLIGPENYERFSLPYLSLIVDANRECGFPTVIHPHGIFTRERFHPLVDKTIETGISGFQFAEKNDFRIAKGKWGNKTCILGGVDIATSLWPGPIERIVQETKEYVGICGQGGGYIFMCSCSLHRGMPIQHVEALVDACRTYGRYPLGLSRPTKKDP